MVSVAQVKVREEEQYNRVEVEQVEGRLPGLLHMLLARLEVSPGVMEVVVVVLVVVEVRPVVVEVIAPVQAKEDVAGRLVDPALIPILTVLTRSETTRPWCT